ncbi:MAG: hypothetical protein A2Y07_08615 [Planctomycetes bacterium GWF2_50_10]|nr:MAG: hypothetical protein A2Y07_08615 [Planctomycetes bacterium GWF2_50_10]
MASFDLDGSLIGNTGNIHSRECRTALTEMMMRLFDLWQINYTDQAALLNRSLGSIRRYRSGRCIGDDEEMYDRVATLLGIHKNLRILYPYNRDLVYSWVSFQNQAFGDKSPIEIMKEGFDGLKRVRGYLDYQLQC